MNPLLLCRDLLYQPFGVDGFETFAAVKDHPLTHSSFPLSADVPGQSDGGVTAVLLYRGIRNTVCKQLSIFLNWDVKLGGWAATADGPASAVVVAWGGGTICGERCRVRGDGVTFSAWW